MQSAFDASARPTNAREPCDCNEPRKNLSAIHGNFIPLESPRGLFFIPPRPSRSPRRCQSRSPRRRPEHGVHLHVNFTDSQMDKLASTVSKKDHCPTDMSQSSSTAFLSSSKQGNSATSVPFVAPSQGGVPVKQEKTQSLHQQLLGNCMHTDAGLSDSPTSSGHPLSQLEINESFLQKEIQNISEITSDRSSPARVQPRGNIASSSMIGIHMSDIDAAASRNIAVPKPNDEQPFGSRHHAREFYSSSKLPQAEPKDAMRMDTSSSIYSASGTKNYSERISPLQVKKETTLKPSCLRKPVVPKKRVDLGTACSPASLPSPFWPENGSDDKVSSWVNSNQPEATGHNAESVYSKDGGDAVMQMPAASTEHYPPLNVPGEFDLAVVRKGRKILVGQNGWLEQTKNPEKMPLPPKMGGILGTLKRVAKEVADATDLKYTWRVRDNDRGRKALQLKTSLDPREQSLLYCELEFLLTTVLDGYITSQFNAGRLDAGKYKRTVDGWHQKGRPRVVGFRFDLETQLKLVHLHLEQFRFYGDRAGVPAAMAGILEMMEVNARAIRIRTFCLPDSVIAKQLIDSQNLLDLLGCSEPRQIQLAAIVQFFKVILEREHLSHFEPPRI